MESKNEFPERCSGRTKRMWCYKSLGKIFVKRHGEIKKDKDFVVKKERTVVFIGFPN